MLLVMVQPAAAQLVDRSHQHVVLTIPNDQICDVPVTSMIDFVANDQERLAQSGFPLFKTTGRGTIIWTNPVTGKSLRLSFTGASKDLTVADNGDGTITLRTALTGIPQELMLSNGQVVAKDVGRVVFVSVINYNGTPTDTSDDVTISTSIESISGPHPQLQGNFSFCEAVDSALT